MIRRLFERKKPSILSPLFLHFLNSSLGVTPRDEKWYIEAKIVSSIITIDFGQVKFCSHFVYKVYTFY